MILRIIPRFLVVNSIAILRMVLKMILKLGIAIELHPCNPGDGLLSSEAAESDDHPSEPYSFQV